MEAIWGFDGVLFLPMALRITSNLRVQSGEVARSGSSIYVPMLVYPVRNVVQSRCGHGFHKCAERLGTRRVGALEPCDSASDGFQGEQRTITRGSTVHSGP